LCPKEQGIDIRKTSTPVFPQEFCISIQVNGNAQRRNLDLWIDWKKIENGIEEEDTFPLFIGPDS